MMKKRVKTSEKWPKGHLKILNFFYNLARKESFMSDVRKIRKQFNIPSNGFPIKVEDQGSTFRISKKLRLKEEQTSDFNKQIARLLHKYKARSLENAKLPIEYFLFYDVIQLPEYYDLSAIQDIKNPGYSKSRFGECLYSDSDNPIAIRISPSASKRDILDFVSYNYKRYIKPLQILYKDTHSELGKNRERDDESWLISDLIWKNRDLSVKEIGSILSKNGFFIDLGEIKKIRSLERKRRK